MDKVISFFKETTKNGFLSNFYKSKIKIDGKTYLTVEHYFQSKKFDSVETTEGFDIEEYIRKSLTPKEAFQRGRSKTFTKYMRKDWNEAKEGVMAIGLYAKFTQHIELKQALLDTDGYKLVENSPYDGYWGVGKNKNGRNRLGYLLMKLRDQLIAEQKDGKPKKTKKFKTDN